MRQMRLGFAAASAIAIACAAPAQAAVLTFNGSATGLGNVTADAACAPRGRGIINPASTSGSSTLGAFTYGHTVCTSGPPGGPIDGTFAINFGSDGFFGTLSGVTARNATVPTFFDFDIAYSILGGTGRFLGASGAFATGPGSGANINFQPSRITLNFVNGAINAPAVPEPGTWALLILGFGSVGATMRRRPMQIALA